MDGLNPQHDPPEWWQWDLAFTPHLETRMEEREFSEVELRGMISDVVDLTPARRPGRFAGFTRLRGRPWVVILEPDMEDRVVFVVTAYSRDQR
jgi:hypothetical protein